MSKKQRINTYWILWTFALGIIAGVMFGSFWVGIIVYFGAWIFFSRCGLIR